MVVMPVQTKTQFLKDNVDAVNIDITEIKPLIIRNVVVRSKAPKKNDDDLKKDKIDSNYIQNFKRTTVPISPPQNISRIKFQKDEIYHDEDSNDIGHHKKLMANDKKTSNYNEDLDHSNLSRYCFH